MSVSAPKEMILPMETVEKILSFCDGKTLYNARRVSEKWKQCIDYLSTKLNIWKMCCYEEIPETQLIEYLEKFRDVRSDDKYMHIYDNWTVWQNVERNVDFEISLCPLAIPRISCLAVSGRCIAVGSEDGRVRIFNDSWEPLYVDRFLGVKVSEITFMHDDERKEDTRPLLIIAYKSGILYLIDYEDRFMDPLILHDVKMYSVYKRFLCLVKTGERVSIVKYVNERDSDVKRFFEITYMRIYSPNEVTGVTIWKGVCTFLMNSDVKILKYDREVQPMSTVENKSTLMFCTKNDHGLLRTCQIYRNDIIISLSFSEGSLRDQLIELFILGAKGTVGKKLFNTWEVLQSHITCMFLYGNTFILGVDIGNVYFYTVDSWKKFDIRKYKQRIIIGKHPIISIDVKETKGERKFYIASSYNIHEVIGFSIINLRP